MTYRLGPMAVRETPVERLRNLEQSLTLKVWEARPLTMAESVRVIAELRDRVTQIREQLER